MQRKLVGYFLLSFLSFCFFTVVFNAIAIVQVSADQPAAKVIQPIISLPTPTIYNTQQIVQTNQISSFIPTPTLYEKTQVLAAATQPQTSEQEQKVIATPIPPTATP